MKSGLFHVHIPHFGGILIFAPAYSSGHFICSLKLYVYLDIDECELTELCQNGGTCNNMDGSYTCDCVSGFTGQHCENGINFVKL